MSPSELKYTSLITTLTYAITDKLQDNGIDLGSAAQIGHIRMLLADVLEDNLPTELTQRKETTNG